MKKIMFLMLIGTLSLLVAGLAAGPTSAGPPPHSSGVPANANVVELTAHHLEFEGPSEIPSGWTTIRLKNESEHTHFATLSLYPDGKGIEDHQAIIAPIFQEGSELLWAGNIPEALAKFGELPAWFINEVVIIGGPGLTAPGRTSQSTVYLEPGTYVVECYVKTDRVFHSVPSDLDDPEPSEYGMAHEITVTETPSGASAPEPTLEMTLSTERGIEVADNVRPGLHTVAVHFESQTVHQNFVGHDVHLARLAHESDLAALETWMNSLSPDGLQTPAPVEFVGGTNELPAGQTAYFTVLLKPGHYAWIAEVPNPGAKGMLKTFTVPAGLKGH